MRLERFHHKGLPSTYGKAYLSCLEYDISAQLFPSHWEFHEVLQVHTSNVITQPGWQGFYSSSLAIDSAVCITFSRRLKGQGSAHGAYRFGQTFSLVFGSATLGKAAIITMAKADSALRTSRVVPTPVLTGPCTA